MKKVDAQITSAIKYSVGTKTMGDGVHRIYLYGESDKKFISLAPIELIFHTALKDPVTMDGHPRSKEELSPFLSVSPHFVREAKEIIGHLYEELCNLPYEDSDELISDDDGIYTTHMTCHSEEKPQCGGRVALEMSHEEYSADVIKKVTCDRRGKEYVYSLRLLEEGTDTLYQAKFNVFE